MPGNQKLSILTENWHTWYIGGFDSESRLRLLKFRPQNLFLGKFRPKSQSCLFCLNIGTHGISRMLILISTLVSNPNFLYGQVWAKKVKVVRFKWKLARMVSWKYRFVNPDLDFRNSDPKIHFWANLDWKTQSCPVWLKIGIQSVSTMLILIPTWHTRSYTRSCTRTYAHTRSYFDISFLKFQTYILRMLILILRFFLYRS